MAENQATTLVEKLHLLPTTTRAIMALAESVAALNASAEGLVVATAGSTWCLSYPEVFSPGDYGLIRQEFERGEQLIEFLNNLNGDPDLEPTRRWRCLQRRLRSPLWQADTNTSAPRRR